ncbi:tripartite tricarboxylate transporter TctB family protein [Bacillus sp. RAR_GA_16]|uniref:tripartite tricarboxylate transporter TctB family protein n=1 Tax=Bacillus sp. RAR_GA_16 TaxID=2876774 RepID=UPI001CCA75E3|nr:tripartite tricarboxylate transporter TctB family protein [Bacillus sp. RAR_GA_16]MCA0174556.1 tripartite tricarboxylate transporter TctB family protein [Bacillus sp. RAR_GA_16]
MKKERIKDLVIAAIVLGISFVFYINTRTLTPPADIFPKVVITIFTVLGVILLLKAIFYKKYNNETDGDDQEKIDAKRRWLSIIGLFAYIIMIPFFGFYITSAIYLTFVSISLNDKKFSYTSLLKPIIVSSLVMFVLYGTFSVFLKVPIPGGMFI